MSFKDLDALLDFAAGSGPRSGQPPPASTRHHTLLVVDDDESIRNSLYSVLSPHYHVVMCESALQGIRALTAEMSAVILDVKMSPHDGFWACSEIRKIQPDIPVIFYSAYQDIKDPFQIINEHRPFGYIMKDGDPNKLLVTLETATHLYHTTLRSKRIIERLKRRKGAAL
jgi:DNA-binding NtrC family response regulator